MTGTDDRPKPAMHARLLNAISLVVGSGFSFGLFLSIAHYLNVQENEAPQVREDKLEILTLAIPPPPPPPRPDDRPAVIGQVPDAIALGFQEEPSVSPLKIAPSPPNYEQLLPVSPMPSHVVSGIVGIDTLFNPTIDLEIDTDHVYQRSEVDKPPFLISRPDSPSVPAHLLSGNKGLSVVVLFVVDAHGVVGKPHILRSSDNAEFDSIIADFVREWKFSPAIKNGKPVRCMVQQPVRLQMDHRDIFSL